MSIKAICWAFEQDLPPTSKLVLLKLADNANDDGWCWPSQATLARHTSLTRETVNRHIAKLEESGHLTVKRRKQEGVNLPNHYLLNLRGVVSDEGGVVTEDHNGSDRRSQPVVTEDHTNRQKAIVNEPSKVKTGIFRSDPARDIFEYWQGIMEKPRAKFGADQRKKINARLEEGWEPDLLKQAVDGCKASDWHMGANPRNRRYDSIDLIFRNAGKVQEFIDLNQSTNTTAAAAWLEGTNGRENST